MQITRWEMIVDILKNFWRWIIVGAWVLAGVYDLLVSQILPNNIADKFPRLGDIGIQLTWFLWLIILEFLILIVLFEWAYREIDRLRQQIKLAEDEPAELELLGKIRTRGVRIRNDWAGLKKGDELPDFQTVYEDWDEKMIKTLRNVSPGLAAWLTTLDRWWWRYGGVNNEHRRYLNIIDEKVRRLGIVLERYFGLE